MRNLIRNSKKITFLKTLQKWPIARNFSDRSPANLRKFWTFPKGIDLYTNRRRILRWFQKCITSYVYLAKFLIYGRSKSENGPLWPIFDKTSHFQTLNGHKLNTTQDKHTKLYIFEISVKFCVDWYINQCLLEMFKIFLN